MRIKILGFDCSPRKNSNSGALLQASFAAAREKLSGTGELVSEIIHLRDCDIKHCNACSVCGKRKDTGEYIPCVIKDDMTEILAKMCEADGMAVATPVYFGLPSDLFSKFIMRTRVLRHQDFRLANKPVGIMAIAGRRSGGAETTIMSAWLPFIRNGCLIVGNGDQTCQFGTMGWAGPCGHILSDEWGLEQGEQTVRRIFEVASLVHAGQQALGQTGTPMHFSYTSGNRPQ
ncbi:MAG: flavodoxin family protein [Oligosphaeraceae bacterium]|nr:flavodoxin family protein [Oligosphaeraceae bacterium]